MKSKIIPTNFALNSEIFIKKLKILNFSKEIHIDFMDGIFTKNKSISIKEISNIISKNDFKNKYYEIHLMAFNPISYLDELIKTNITKVLFHIEAFYKENNLNYEDLIYSINKFKKNNFKTFIVINPNSNIDSLNPILNYIDGIMFMSVEPGAEGQRFIKETLIKIKNIKNILKEKEINLPIQIDGGININNFQEIIESGIDIISIGSYISSNENPKKVYLELNSIIKNN